ncbi:carcinoembryonic antigen-related cell adhesion molecule 1-like [Hyperolius riggenbachi]|uniref:carcinoembryonic antigen-related cell adhesion molecule 1-like n=1 Tax=Hyperolius riggenbachi TaxID=752182 RepID=UPI0035A393F0
MKKSAIVCLLIPSLHLLLNLCCVAAQTSHTANGLLGGSVTFIESISRQDNPVIGWSFNAVAAIAQWKDGTAEYFGSYKGRCTMFMNGTLRLDSLTYADSGIYGMTVQRPPAFIPITTSIYELSVLPPLSAPIFSSNSTNNNKHVSGTYMSLHCNGGNQPITRYTFYRDGKDICSEPHVTCKVSNLYFQPITESDSGIYTCVIQNPASSNTSNALQLTVSVKSRTRNKL